MNEAIENVLNDESLTTTQERLDAIKKNLAPLVMPKDKYNDVCARLRNAESENQTLLSEFNAYKQSKMTDDEKLQAQLESIASERKTNALTKSELGVKSLLLDNGIKVSDDDIELKETLSNIISEDYDKSIKLANSFISLLNKTKDVTEKETTTKLLNETPKPIGGLESSKAVSHMDELMEQYNSAVERKDTLEQVRLMREIQEENAKVNI